MTTGAAPRSIILINPNTSASVTAEMVRIIAAVQAAAPDGWVTAAAFRDRLQNGRKVAIEILDFYDRQGVTLRRGDLRRINPHRADLFG